MEVEYIIKEMREETGLTQNRFAAEFDIPVRTLQQWEQGKSEPPEYVMKMMKRILSYEKLLCTNKEGRNKKETK